MSEPGSGDIDVIRALKGRRIVMSSARPLSLVMGGMEIMLLKTHQAMRELGLDAQLLDVRDPAALDGQVVAHVYGSDYPVQQLVSLLKGRSIPVLVSPVYYPLGSRRLIDAVTSRIPTTLARLQRLVSLTADRLLPNSRDEGLILQRLFGVPASRIAVVHNGVDPAVVGSDPDGFRAKYLPELSKNERFVLCAARIEERKRTDLLIRSCSALRLPLVLLGRKNTVQPEFVASVNRELARARNFVKHIEALPHGSPDLANAYAAASVHALASDMETPGLSSLEAAANGCNVVVGDCPPVREYFEGKAWFVAPRDEGQLAKALGDAMAAPRDAKGQKAWVLSRFTWEQIARDTARQHVAVLREKGAL